WMVRRDRMTSAMVSTAGSAGLGCIIEWGIKSAWCGRRDPNVRAARLLDLLAPILAAEERDSRCGPQRTFSKSSMHGHRLSICAGFQKMARVVTRSFPASRSAKCLDAIVQFR